MKLEGEQRLLRIFIGEQDKWKGAPLYEAIANEALTLRMAGITVTRGLLGFGCNAHIHTAKLLELSYDLPIVVEIVDTERKIRQLIPKLDKMVQDGLVTLEKVHVMIYRAKRSVGRAKE